MLDTGASSSIINYRTFWEICQTQHPISVKRSTIQTKTYSGQVVPMIGLATLIFSYDPDGQFTFPLTVWITEMKTQNLLGIVKSKYLASILNYPALNLKSHQILCVMEAFIRTNHTPSFRESQRYERRMLCTLKLRVQSAGSIFLKILMLIFQLFNFSTFQPNRNAIATGLSFVNVLCTQSGSKLPILMENNNHHQITLPKGRFGFSSLDISDKDEPRYQIRDPYELTNAILLTNEQYNDCFLLHSFIPSQLPDEFLQIVYGNENSILQQPNSIGHCISADAQMSKGFAQFLSGRVPRLRRTCGRANLFKDQVFPFWDSSSRRYIFNLVTKEKYSDKPDLQTLATTLQSMQSHSTMHGVSTIAIPKIGCGLDQMNWQDVVKLLRDIFAYSDVQIVVYSLDEHAIDAMSAKGDPEFYAEDGIDRHSEEFQLNERELETDFTSDAKSCQPDCDEQIPILRPKEQNEALIEHYLQYQPKELIDYVKQFDFQYSDITDNEMPLLIDMLIESKNVYSLQNSTLEKPDRNFTLH